MTTTRFAELVIAGAAAFFALLLVYSVVKDSWVVYTILSASIAAALIASLKLRGAVKVKLALVLVSTGLTLLAAEVILTVAPETPVLEARIDAARKAGVFFDARETSQVVKDLRAQGVDAYTTVTARSLLQKELVLNTGEIFPLGGIANRTIVFCNELGEYQVFTSDKHGFNNPQGTWDRDRIDVVTIGDSFVQGACVDSDRSIPALIREVHQSTLNVGLGGIGPLIEFAILKEYLVDLEPQTVLWFYFEGDDLHALEFGLRFPQLRKYLEADYRQNLADKQEQIDSALTPAWNRAIDADKSWSIRPVLDRLTLLSLRQRFVTVRCPAAVSGETIEVFQEILAEAKSQVGSWQGDLYFVYLPTWERYTDSGSSCKFRRFRTSLNLHDPVLDVVNDVGIPMVDVSEAFDAHPDPLSLFPFRLPGHYTEEGYRIVADLVLEAIGGER